MSQQETNNTQDSIKSAKNRPTRLDRLKKKAKEVWGELSKDSFSMGGSSSFTSQISDLKFPVVAEKSIITKEAKTLVKDAEKAISLLESNETSLNCQRPSSAASHDLVVQEMDLNESKHSKTKRGRRKPNWRAIKSVDSYSSGWNTEEISDLKIPIVPERSLPNNYAFDPVNYAFDPVKI